MKLLAIKIAEHIDTDPDTSYLGFYSNTPADNAIDREARGEKGRGEYRYFIPATEYTEADYSRSESLNRGDWHFIGIQAVAEIQVTLGGPTQKITSGGIWGIESDSDPAYINQLAEEQFEELSEQLRALGVPACQVKKLRPSAIRD